MKQISSELNCRAGPHQGRRSDRAARAHRRAGVGCMALPTHSGTRPPGSHSRRGPRFPATSTSTSRSWAPATPACGRRTTCAGDPSLRIAVLEAEIAGFGARGRNGGWCSALFPTVAGTLAPARRATPPCACAGHARHGDEVGRVAAGRGHRLPLPRAAPSRWRAPRCSSTRARAEVAEHARCGFGEDDFAAARCRRGARRCWPPTACSARPTPRTARRSTPRGWCAGLARVGGGAAASPIYEQTRVDGDPPGPRWTTARHGRAPTSWCARPRATRRSCPGCAAPSRRCTR